MEQQASKGLQEIDIKKIFYEKNPKVARWVPGFIYRYLKKIAHQDYTNEIIRDYGHLKGFEFTKAMIKHFNVTLEVEGEENIPDSGKYIFASNHPLGGFDGHTIMYIIGHKYGADKYKFLVNDILMNPKNMDEVFIPVNKHGGQGHQLAQQLDEAFQSDAQILTFPAGFVSRKVKGQVMDLVWQKNFITKSKQYQRDIVPIFHSGKNTKYFYRLYQIRKFLGIKANIEMLYLIDQTYKHRNKKFVVKFGKPIPWQTFDKSKRPAEWAKWVKDIVYKMDGYTKVPV
jgi:1-acyl-sn-glycerol-3-phosphate acyltransferase